MKKRNERYMHRWSTCSETSISFKFLNRSTKAPYLNSKVKRQLINYKKGGPKFTALPACHEVTAFVRYTRSIYVEMTLVRRASWFSWKGCRWLRHQTFDWLSQPIQHSNKGQILPFSQIFIYGWAKSIFECLGLILSLLNQKKLERQKRAVMNREISRVKYEMLDAPNCENQTIGLLSYISSF